VFSESQNISLPSGSSLKTSSAPLPANSKNVGNTVRQNTWQ